jgi:hypothetical protein
MRYAGSGRKPNKSTLKAAYLTELVSKAFIRSPRKCDGCGHERIRRLIASAAHVEVDSTPLYFLVWHPNLVKMPLLDIFSKFNLEGATVTAKS